MTTDTSSDETWKPIPGWENYLVSDRGRIWSLHTDALLRGSPNDRGYWRVTLHGPDGRKDVKIHLAVMLAFVGPRPAGMDVCHADRDKSNNALSNLRYDTRSANVHDQVKHGVHYEANKTHCPAGHRYTPQNTYFKRKGIGRECRQCIRDRRRRRRHVEVADCA
jgi:hypothetical protein